MATRKNALLSFTPRTSRLSKPSTVDDGARSNPLVEKLNELITIRPDIASLAEAGSRIKEVECFGRTVRTLEFPSH